MRKMLLTVAASCAVIALVPASAIASKGHRHHHGTHAHHSRVRHLSWGSDQTQTTPQSQSQDAGTVQSFTNGVLTILLNDNKTTVSGQVTMATQIDCGTAQPAAQPTGMDSHDQSQGDNGSSSGGNDGQSDSSSTSGSGGSGNDDQSDDQGQGDDENASQTCDSSALTPGTVVHEAALSISSAGAVWNTVDLVTQSSPASPSQPSQPSD